MELHQTQTQKLSQRQLYSVEPLRLIDEEDKRQPLSDQPMSAEMAQEGCPIFRRTVAKYRAELGVPSASGRKMGG